MPGLGQILLVQWISGEILPYFDIQHIFQFMVLEKGLNKKDIFNLVNWHPAIYGWVLVPQTNFLPLSTGVMGSHSLSFQLKCSLVFPCLCPFFLLVLSKTVLLVFGVRQMFKVSFRGVYKKFHGQEVSRVFQESFKSPSRVF